MYPQDKKKPTYNTEDDSQEVEGTMSLDTLSHSASVMKSELDYLFKVIQNAREKGVDAQTQQAVMQCCRDIRERCISIEVYGIKEEK
jgi:hypothetical protein